MSGNGVKARSQRWGVWSLTCSYSTPMARLDIPISYASGKHSANVVAASRQDLRRAFSSPPAYCAGLATRSRRGVMSTAGFIE